MNKLYKILIAWIFTIGIGISFCNAEKVEDLITLVSSWTITVNTTSTSSLKTFSLYDNLTYYWTYCVKFTNVINNNSQSYFSIWRASSSTSNPSNRYNYYFDQVWNTVCLYGNKRHLNITNYMQGTNNVSYATYNFTIDYEIYKLSTLLDTDITCPTCEICETCNYTWYINSLKECTNNLNTCQSSLNSCLAWNYTWLNWSALFLNGQQITSNAIIDINAENYLKTDIEYLNDTVDIDISFEENTDYIENVINQEKLTPSKEDFETLLIWLTEFIPYLFIALLFIVIVKVTRKIWK